MELRQLEAFVAVAEEANFTRAAERLFVAQSGLSATVRTLERELGAPLFLRTTRRVELTAAGRALLGAARQTLASATAAAEAVAAVAGVRRGTLTLGIMQASSLFDLAGLLARYRRAYPGIELNLQHASGGSAELVRLLGEHRVDVIFTAEPVAASRGFSSILLARSPLVAVCESDHALARRQAVTLRALAAAVLIGFPPGWGVRTLSDVAFRAHGLEPHYAFEVNDTSTLLDLVAAGLGVALLPKALARPGDPRLRQVAISGRRWEWVISAQTLGAHPANPAAQAFWNILAERALVATGTAESGTRDDRGDH